MKDIGIRALKQNASAVVADAAAGEIITITDRGRPVARLTAIATSPWVTLVEAGKARAPRREITELPAPEPGPDISSELTTMRVSERF